MNTQRNKNTERLIEVAAALVIIGAGLNVLVMETLGSVDAAFVILALVVAFWTFVVGNIGLVVGSTWFFLSRRLVPARSTSGQPEADGQIRLKASRLTQPCHAS